MKLCLLVALLVLVPVVEAQQGRVATSYIRINVEPEFQYRVDRDVVIPVQVRVVRDGVPQGDLVDLQVQTTNGDVISVQGQDWLRNVQPYPNVVWVNLGRQDVGLYRVVFHASANGLERDWLTEYDVVYPPQGYEAALVGARGKEARFVFEAHDDVELRVTMYRGSPSAGHVLEEVQARRGEVKVPYVPGESVSIQVEDENGWRNAMNKHTDWSSGVTTYPAWMWNPDYGDIQNYKNQSWREAIVSASLLAAVVAFAYFARRRP